MKKKSEKLPIEWPESVIEVEDYQFGKNLKHANNLQSLRLDGVVGHIGSSTPTMGNALDSRYVED